MIKNTALLKKCEPLYSGDIADRLGKFRGVCAIGNRLFWVYGLVARGQTILSALLWEVKPKEHYRHLLTAKAGELGRNPYQARG